MPEDETFYAAAERRIEYLTLAIGAAAAIAAWIFWSPKTSAGVAAGAVLSWINYRWMKQGIGALARLSTAQAGAEKPRVPASVYLKFLGRYALLIVAAYAILRGFSLPAESFIAGLFAVVAAVLVEMTGQLFRSGPQPRADS
ncbi:MAG TPA: ATP synthase subunit I [Candidatus Limnocylindria bacterium]|nr:ATP synthase subunit I [Candidatus Limnocylindria bacterium]